MVTLEGLRGLGARSQGCGAAWQEKLVLCASAGVPVHLIGSPFDVSCYLIGSPITSHYTGHLDALSAGGHLQCDGDELHFPGAGLGEGIGAPQVRDLRLRKLMLAYQDAPLYQ